MHVIQLQMFCMQGLSGTVQIVCEVARGLKDSTKPVAPNNFLPSGSQEPRSQMIKSVCLAHGMCFYFVLFIFCGLLLIKLRKSPF